MAGLLGRLESWVLGEPSSTESLFASDLYVETPHGPRSGASNLPRPAVARLIVSGGNDEFGSLVYEHEDPATGRWQRTCLVYFGDRGRVQQAYVQSSDIAAPEGG